MRGTVSSIPLAANPSMTLRRPMRSDRAPVMGCKNMKTTSAQKTTIESVAALILAVLTMYFCR
jgi:hypothetical protein